MGEIETHKMKFTAQLMFKRREGSLNRFHPAAWKITIDSSLRFWASCLKEWAKNEDTREISCTVSVERNKKDKTHPQLRYLNGTVYTAFYDEWAELNGARYPNEYVKRILKMHEQVMFVDEATNPITGQIEFEPKSCGDASMEDVSELIDRLLMLAATIGIDIETPEEWCRKNGVSYEDFKRERNEKQNKKNDNI